MVRGGVGNGQRVKKMKLGVKRKKNEKGERKKEENYIKKGGKGLKNTSFWAINSKTDLSGKIKESQKRGRGNNQNAQYISLYLYIF